MVLTGSNLTATDERRDFFISYADVDRPWAVWIAGLLEVHGYRVELDVWDWPVGTDFVRAMDGVLRRADRLLLLLSPAFFDPARYTGEEWSSAVVLSHRDQARLVPVRVEPVDLVRSAPLLASQIYIDLVGLAPERAEQALLAGVAGVAGVAGETGQGQRHPHAAPQGPLAPVYPGSLATEPAEERLPPDFFISYDFMDQAWADWTSLTLERAGFTFSLQAGDLHAGNAVRELRKQVGKARRILALLSPDYLRAGTTSSTWRTVLSGDWSSRQRPILIPVRVEDCELPPQMRGGILVDLVGVDEESARQRLLGVNAPETDDTPVDYPGRWHATPGHGHPSRAQGAASLETRDAAPRQVFLCYRREDSQHATGRLGDRLVDRFGADAVFVDVESVAPGDDFGEAIESAVSRCSVVIAVIGPRWLDVRGPSGERRLEDPDDYVVLELRAALRRGVRVIPVLVDGATMPQRLELPADLVLLARKQAVRLTVENFREDANRLLDQLERLLSPG